MIKQTSKEPSTKNNAIYPQLVASYRSLFRFYQNKLPFNAYHQKFVEWASTLEDRDALIGGKCASDWEATKQTLMQGSNEADRAGQKAFVAQLFMEQANAVDFKAWYDQLS